MCTRLRSMASCDPLADTRYEYLAVRTFPPVGKPVNCERFKWWEELVTGMDHGLLADSRTGGPPMAKAKQPLLAPLLDSPAAPVAQDSSGAAGTPPVGN